MLRGCARNIELARTALKARVLGLRRTFGYLDKPALGHVCSSKMSRYLNVVTAVTNEQELQGWSLCLRHDASFRDLSLQEGSSYSIGTNCVPAPPESSRE